MCEHSKILEIGSSSVVYIHMYYLKVCPQVVIFTLVTVKGIS